MLYPFIIYIIVAFLTGSPIWPLMCIAHPGTFRIHRFGLIDLVVLVVTEPNRNIIKTNTS